MNVLGVGAHFDDLELGCSGALIKHAQAGDRVIMLVISNSAYKNPDGKVIRDHATALAEGRKAAETIGAELICLDVDTFEIQFNEAITKQIHKCIEDNDIDTVYSHWDQDLHRDHRYAAQCTVMAGRHAPRFLMYRSNYYETGAPFGGNFYCDISAVMDRKVEAIKAHKSELERCNYSWLEFITKQNANQGLIIGVEYAEAFSLVRYLI